MNLTSKVNLRSKILPAYIVGNNFFTEQEIDKVRSYCENKETEHALVLDHEKGTLTDNSLRKSKAKFYYPNEDLFWFFEKTFHIMYDLNRDYFGFDLVGYEYFQYTVYEQGDFYTWHTDAPFGYPLDTESHYFRKLSATIVLSDSSEFTGGEFEIMDEPISPTKISQEKGTMILFPSFVNHRVHEVTSGIRKSIVIWALGPMFK